MFLTVALFVSITTFSSGNLSFGTPKSNADTGAANSEDRRVASEISNATGAGIETILKLRNEGKLWNQVLEELKSKGYTDGSSNDALSDFLSRLGTEKDFVLNLKQEGFSDIEIEQGILLADRITFQLQQISLHLNISEYKDLLTAFNRENCIFLILKLYKEFESMEKALDEYLYSLQAGIDLMVYLTDKQEYLKLKREKETGLIKDSIITVAAIEEKMLESISNQNKSNMESNQSTENNVPVSDKFPDTEAENVLPDIPAPKADIPKADNPLDSIMDELEIINPMKNR